MAADALDSAGGFEFGEETDDHAPSLPSAAPERKPFKCGEAFQFPGRPSFKWTNVVDETRPLSVTRGNPAQLLVSNDIGIVRRIAWTAAEHFCQRWEP